MIKRNLIIPTLFFFCLLPARAQEQKQETVLKREVTLYNPYKPTLPEAKKRSFLPDMNDTLKVKREFLYDVTTKPFMPEYTISPIKAAALLPDPLPKLYKSYINIGLGNYLTPLAEISITNERSKKGTIGFYGRHFSSNGKVELANGKKVLAGYMDNDASLFGRKFFRKNVLESSVDFSQKTRNAYGYETDLPSAPDNLKLNYSNLDAKASLSSLTLDSTSFSYHFDVYYNFFYNTRNLYQHNAGINGMMAKSYNDFYVGAGLGYDYYKLPDILITTPKYIASISPFIKKSSDQWSFKLGLQALIDKNLKTTSDFHIYPDINFSFTVVPSYVNFFAGMSGKLEKNEPLTIISEMPYLVPDGRLFLLPRTDHKLIVTSGLKGNNGIGGNYLMSASYSMIDNMLFYSNIVDPGNLKQPEMGNHFISSSDNVDVFQVHGEINGTIGDKISYIGKVNIYKYTLTNMSYPWNKPDWDAKLGLKYNLRDKIIVGAELNGTGRRKLGVGNIDLLNNYSGSVYEMPVHINLDLSAEYRYTKILSFWTRFDNITYNRYYEWAFYPSQRFLFMLGFTYSL